MTMTSGGNTSLNTSQMMQRSWLNDVSPPGSIMSSMEFSINDKMGSSLITSGDFTNVSYLLNANGGDEPQQLNSLSNYDGYKLSDVIKDRKFLENLSCFEDNSMAKDLAISKTDLNGIEENLSGFSTMQNSLESVTKSAEGRLSDVTMVLENGKSDATFEMEAIEAAPSVNVKNLNGTFERRRNFDTYRKPKSSLNSTFDALPKVEAAETRLVRNGTFDAGSNDKPLDETFGLADNCNDTFSLNRTAKINGDERQLNQTYEYCEKNSPNVALLNKTFERPRNGTYIENENASPNPISSVGNSTPNGTFEVPAKNESSRDSMGLAQSTPFVQVPRAKRISDISQYEVNVSPISAVRGGGGRRSEGAKLSRNLESEIALETDDFDVEFRRLPGTPNSKTENGSHLLENEKRISLQQFEEFEKSVMESEQNGVDFDEMLNSLTDVKRSMDSVKLRQSLDSIKRRHSRINSEKQQDELRRRGEMNDSLSSPMDNKLADSMIKSMSSSSGSERLLNRRSRYNDDVHLTLSPQAQSTVQPSKSIDASLQESEQQTNEPKPTESVDPLPTSNEVGGSDRKNRDRFKTIRINKRREEGMVIVPGPEEVDENSLSESATLPMEEELPGSPAAANSSAFSRVDYNSPKESRLSSATSNEQNKTEEAVFKRPQGIPKPDSKVRSLSKPRYYGAPGSGIGLAKKELTLPLKSSSTDCLENDRPSYQQMQRQQSPSQLQRLSLGGNRLESGRKIGAAGSVQSNLKSPMGTKSKSYHNLYYNQSNNHGGSNSNLNRIPTPLGLSAQKLSHNNSNTELKNNTSKLQLNLRTPRASSLVRPGTTTTPATLKNSAPEINIRSRELNPSSITTTSSNLSGVQMRAPKAGSRLGLVRPSSGYFSYSSQKKPADSDTESINSLSSSSASSRGSLYRVDSQNIANNVQNYATHSIEDISGSAGVVNGGSLGLRANLPAEPNRTAVNPAKSIPVSGISGAKPSGLRPPSNLRPPTARSGLPRPTSYVRR